MDAAIVIAVLALVLELRLAVVRLTALTKAIADRVGVVERDLELDLRPHDDASQAATVRIVQPKDRRHA